MSLTTPPPEEPALDVAYNAGVIDTTEPVGPPARDPNRKQPRPLVERAGRAAFFNAIFFPIKVFIGFAASVIVVRLLRIEGFFLLTVTTSFLNLLGLVSDFGIERTLPRFYPEIEMRFGRRGVMRLLFWISAIKGGVLLLLIAALLLAPDFWINLLQLGEDGGWLLLSVVVLLVFGAASDVTVQLLYTHFRQKATNSLEVLAAVVYPTLTATFVLLGWNVLGAMLALVITTVVSATISIALAARVLLHISDEASERGKAVNIPSKRPLRERLLSLAGVNYLINWTTYLYDLPFLVFILTLIYLAPDDQTKAQVAILGLAFKFTKQLLRALVVPLTGVQTPLFARLYAEGRIDGLKTAYATITKFLILGLLPACIGLIFLCRNLIQIIYLQVGRDAVVTQFTIHAVIACTVILAIGLFGESLISVGLNVLLIYEDYRTVLFARLLALTSIPLLFLLVPQYGAVGAAIAAAVAGLVSRGAALYFAIRRVGVRFPGEFFTRVGLASAAMGVALLPMLTLPATILVTLSMLIIGLAVFYGAFKLLGGMDERDKERFRALRVPFVGVALKFL